MRDWRLTSPAWSEEAYAEASAKAEDACLQRVTPEEVARVSRVIADRALARLRGEPSSVELSTADALLNEAARATLAVVLDDEKTGPETPEARLLGKAVARALAKDVAGDPAMWIPGFRVASNLAGGWTAFLAAFDVEAIRSSREELFRFPSIDKADEWLDLFARRRLRDGWSDFVSEMNDRTDPRRDPWRELEYLERISAELLLSEEIRMRSALARQGGAVVWVEFLALLPLPIFSVVEIGGVDSLDEARAILQASLLRSGSGPSAHILVLAILQRFFALLSAIGTALTQASAGRWLPPGNEKAEAYRQRCADALKRWQDVEVSDQAFDVAAVLASGGAAGYRAAVSALQNILSWSMSNAAPETELATIGELRDALAFALLNHGYTVEELASSILDAGVRSSAVFSAMHLVHLASPRNEWRRRELVEKLWKTFCDWIGSAEFSAHVPFNADQAGFAWRAAGIAAELPNPARSLRALLSERDVSAEGWRYDSGSLFSSLDRVAYAVIVTAMASEWILASGREDDAKEAFRAGWEFLHTWLRWYPGLRGATDLISTALGNLWGRLPRTYGNDAQTIAWSTLDTLDRIEWILLACKNLQANLPKGAGTQIPVLDGRLREVIARRFEQQFAAVRVEVGAKAEVLRQFEDWHRDVTGGV